MLSAVCKEFLEQITSHFWYLFEQCGFQMIHCDEAKSGEYCLVILQSEDCRVKIYRSQGEVNLQFGTLSALVGWEDMAEGVRQWYYIRGIVNFLRREPLDIGSLLQESRQFKTDDQQLSELSRELQPICDQVIGLFRKDVFEQWQEQYERFEEEREREFRIQYEEWRRARSTSKSSTA